MSFGRRPRQGVLDTVTWIACAAVLSGLWIGAQGSLSKRRVVRVEGDIILGALFPVHRQPSGQKTAYIKQCGEIWEQYGMHRIEIFLKTLREINDDPSILPNVTLGCDIRDSCWYPPVALEQSIDFIKNSIASRENLNKTREAGPNANKPIAGLIGPGSSTVTIQVQNLLSLFNIPQIGYSATSKDLSDKSLYKYFLRVVPSDKLQARALVDLVLYYNWTYISTVYTEGNYGWRGMQEFQAMAEEVGLCTAAEEKVDNNGDDESYDLVVDSLQLTPNARVVVCFCEGMSVRRLLTAMARKGVAGQFLVIGSDGWAVRPDVVVDIEDVSVGGISFKLYSPEIRDFDNYYRSLKPYKDTSNPWFREFWQQKFNCSLKGVDADLSYSKPCTGDEDLSKVEYVQDAKLGFVVNAIYTMAYALNNMHKDLCKGHPGICRALNPVDGSVFLQYLLNVSFVSYSKDDLHFNQNGDPPGRYDIMNFQAVTSKNGTRSYDYVRIGGWDNGNLTMDNNRIFWPNKKAAAGAPVIESVCSKPCPKGQVKVIRDRAHCCWVCTACEENQFMLDEFNCKSCPTGWWPNENLTACLMIDIDFMQWNDTEAIVSMAFACVGIFAVVWVAAVFIRHNNTAVVKASTRELSYIILLGICISYFTTFPLVAKPSLVTCYLTRILPGWSFSMIYGALLTKTNRIARILAGSKKKIMTRKPRFMSASAQVVITCILIGVECAIITVMLIFEPADSKLDFPTATSVKLTCNATTMGIIVPLAFDIFLIVMCTLYAIKTRNLPENFNEAKFIGFTMYTTCIIWLAFVPIYFGSDSKVITMCLAITLSASVALILLFFPKVYIIVCKPERNNRSAFTTSKEVRCHIGSTGARSLSTDSFDRLYTGKVKSKGAISLFSSWKTGNLDQRHKQAKAIVHSPRMSPSLARSGDHDNKPWHDKPFESAAMSMYRQKNFFTRWREKSTRAGSSSSSRGRPRPGNVASGNRVAGSRGTNGYSHTEDKSCNHGAYQNKHPPASEHQNSIKGKDSNQNRSANKGSVHRNPSLRSIGFQKPVAIDYVDSDAQTDMELLEPLLTTLRHRKVSNTERDRACQSNVLVIKPQDLHNETDEDVYLRQSTRNNFPPYSSCQHASADSTEEREMDSLLKAGDPYLDLESQASSQAYSFLGQSPLLPGSERSPLLGSVGIMCDDTTSEETLSEHGDHEDLEELLLGAGECQGSFSSVASSNSNAKWNPSAKRGSSDSSAHVQVIPGKAFFGYHNRSVDVNVGAKTNKPATKPKPYVYHKPSTVGNTDVFRLNKDKQPTTSSVSDNVFTYDIQASEPTPGDSASSSESPSSVPRIYVNRATPQTSGSEPYSEITGSNSSFRTDFSCVGSSIGDSGHPMTGTPDSRCTSTSGSSTSGDRMASGLSSSNDDMIRCGMTKEDSVTKFQEYLRTRGVDLDLSTVQSSDV